MDWYISVVSVFVFLSTTLFNQLYVYFNFTRVWLPEQGRNENFTCKINSLIVIWLSIFQFDNLGEFCVWNSWMKSRVSQFILGRQYMRPSHPDSSGTRTRISCRNSWFFSQFILQINTDTCGSSVPWKHQEHSRPQMNPKGQVMQFMEKNGFPLGYR